MSSSTITSQGGPAHPRHILVAGCLVRNPAGELLLVRHHQRGWELPQGRVEEGESLSAALEREVYEETGVEIADARLALIWSKLSEPAAVIFGFVADFAGGSLRPSSETPEVTWLKPAEAEQRVSHPVNRDRLQQLVEAGDGVELRAYQTAPYRMLPRHGPMP